MTSEIEAMTVPKNVRSETIEIEYGFRWCAPSPVGKGMGVRSSQKRTGCLYSPSWAERERAGWAPEIEFTTEPFLNRSIVGMPWML